MTDEKDYSEYRDKPPTPLQERFDDWIIEKTGYNPATAKTKQQAFEDGVRLSVYLRIPFQASPENRAATEELRAQRAEEAEALRQQREEAKALKAQEREEAAAARAAAKEEAANSKAAKAAGKATPAPTPEPAPEPEASASAKPAKPTARGRARSTTTRTPAPF